jgi:hypothetical protein
VGEGDVGLEWLPGINASQPLLAYQFSDQPERSTAFALPVYKPTGFRQPRGSVKVSAAGRGTGLEVGRDLPDFLQDSFYISGEKREDWLLAFFVWYCGIIPSARGFSENNRYSIASIQGDQEIFDC